MGVKINTLVESAKKVITYDMLFGKIIVIDAFNTLYQFLASIRGVDGNLLKDLKGRDTSYLSGLFYRNIHLINQNIKLVYVFDGKPNILKADEINRRKELRELAEHNFKEVDELSNQSEFKKYAQGSSRLTGEMIDNSKALLQAIGIPVIQAPQDGEAQASYMIQKEKAFAIGSQDYDSFLFGANRIIRNVSVGQTRTIRGVKEKVDLEYYTMEKVLAELEITRQQLVDISILVGVDFFEGIKGIGDKTALKLIKEYQNLEGIMKAKKESFNFDKLTPDFLTSVRNIFLKPNVTDDYKLIFPKPNFPKIKEIMVEEHNFDPQRIDNTLKPLIERSTTRTQINLSKWT